MIEVEKKFKPAEEQLEKLLSSAEFLGEVVNHDIYYDYADYRLFKKSIRLRDRNGRWELKIGQADGVAQEVEDEEGIRDYFKIGQNLGEFIQENLIPIIDYKTTRKKYKKGEFAIDVDRLSFGYDLCEIELLVEKQEDIQGAEEKILQLAKEYDFVVEKLPAKRTEYLRLVKPEVYKELFRDVGANSDIDITVD